MSRDTASQRQVDAARPDRSTWLAANAGSGKTRVLTDRVARLLLDGVLPQHILCLTYTKAAATEMQNRLFKRLGHWAMLPDDQLRTELETLGIEDRVTAGRLNLARTLFARAIETPGGLKIQTIHSFCAALLRRFPLEAGVSPQFTEMEERDATLLRAEVIDRLARRPDAGVLERVALFYSGASMEGLAATVAGHADLLSRQPGRDALERALGLPAGYEVGDLLGDVFLGSEMGDIAALCAAARGGSANDVKLAEKLAGVTAPDLRALAVLEDCFLLKKEPFSAKIGKVPTKATQSAHPELMDRIEPLMARVETARSRRLALELLDRTVALHDFARLFLPDYARAKMLRGAMDFDDLILRARDLLTNQDVSAWVLFRLDGGIDHILVDEAQDTSPVQWQVIQALAREFTSGAGAQDDKTRTIFVVGDKKQSIYSFQGADPSEFDRMREEFDDRLTALGTPLQRMALAHSFRSAPALLALVDKVFEGRVEAGFSPDETHIAFHETLPGRVDLWPLVEKVENTEEGEWDDPVDLPGEQDHNVVLARRIARTIRGMIDDRTPLPLGDGTARPIHAGDILILVRRRRRLFHEIIRACKGEDLDIAGADRLRIGAEIAVKDLTALLSFLATPDDDLGLAAVLKSPLFGWDEQMLFDLAHRRETKRLWPALDAREDHAETRRILRDLRDHADFLRPYELLERVLIRHDGRRRLMARLGTEAQDGIDALLDQALAYERTDVPSLTGFLVWLQGDDPEVKRQMESAGSRIRVMTVHGSKGLEAPVVFMPETQARREELRGEVLSDDDLVWWNMPAREAPPLLAGLREAKLRKQREETDRLLYVAMTRAEKWLIVAAAGELGKSGDTWYERIRDGMTALGAAPLIRPDGEGLRLESGDWQGLTPIDPPARQDRRPALPDWATRPAPRAAAAPRTLSPSELGGAKALPGEEGLDEEAAKRRGRQIHRLLEHLPGVPETELADRAAFVLGHGPDAAEGEELALLTGEAQRILFRPNLRHLFGPEALVEVSVTADLDALDGRRIHGTIDRLIVGNETVLAVDYKTNAVVPDRPEQVPDALLRQMGAYAAALARIYPGRKIETALLWTRTADLMVLPQDLVIAALHDTTTS
ncbi:ATP-dependent DNA helicase, UvrD/Rep family protein [Pseudooceanicola batsensis HTCC2597]|uniref:DNA 3'-5' helicase n=1 Tax=Pseudooceanicola batsensis (strain ATCC BAA-863 / DSM 15984 / KCTC 12145 / HTCC2597) TaxID=252305 RepID=A3TXV7_PSEBH|nr:double-strand break repair helicase AddA [Pseudooceanicola batsensis]EAQ02991.1 ATP-dependent DNA helicase, UvrD/Rep family protein [Pseudooceanicola batsensis HTCC2597]